MASPSLGPFALRRALARGGIGEVWHAVHRSTRTRVAVQVVRPGSGSISSVESGSALSPGSGAARAILDEVRGMAMLTTRTSCGCSTAASWMPEAGTLAQAFDALRWPELATIVSHLLDALAHAHGAGLIHRDIKPANVLMGGMRPGPKLSPPLGGQRLICTRQDRQGVHVPFPQHTRQSGVRAPAERFGLRARTESPPRGS